MNAPRRDFDPDDITADTLYAGRLQFLQPRNGYRFSLDSVALIDFARSFMSYGSIVDLCSGCGVVGISLAAQGRASSLVCVELQDALASVCRRNVAVNKLHIPVDVLNINIDDCWRVISPQTVTTVVANPPYWSPSAGRLPADLQLRIARHELQTDIPRLLKITRQLLHPAKGTAYIAFPASRSTEFISRVTHTGFGVKRLRFVHPGPVDNAEFGLFELSATSRTETRVLPPLVLRDYTGTETPAARHLYEFNESVRPPT